MAEFKHIVRIADTDLQGSKAILFAMKKIKGVDVMYGNAVLSVAGINKSKKAGDLIQGEVSKLNQILQTPENYNIPHWLYNRRIDYETGEPMHVMGGKLRLMNEDDIKRMKKTKSYKGLRHQWGLTVRGQRTKSNFRKVKSKSVKKR